MKLFVINMAEGEQEMFEEIEEDHWDPVPENWGQFPMDYSK